ncbi:MAG: rRNA maturation RNase YbeY [Actinomycetota bacterium]
MTDRRPDQQICVLDKQTELIIDAAKVAKEAADVLAAEKATDAGELTITFVNKTEMANLNLTYRHQAGPTDVLSFSMVGAGNKDDGFASPVPVLGDVVVCPELIAEIATKEEADVQRRIMEAMIHGILHILGYSHGTAAAQEGMFARQAELLDKQERAGTERNRET